MGTSDFYLSQLFCICSCLIPDDLNLVFEAFRAEVSNIRPVGWI